MNRCELAACVGSVLTETPDRINISLTNINVSRTKLIICYSFSC